MASSQSVLEILIQAVDNSAAAFQNALGNLSATGDEAKQANEQLKTVGEQATKVGEALAPLAAAFDAAYGGSVAAAAETQDANDRAFTTISNTISQASQSTAGYSTQVAFLQNKINAEEAAIASATATLDKNTGSTQSVQAAHEKASASIATAQGNIQKYQAQLDLLTQSQALAGSSAEDLMNKFEGMARSNTDLGFSISDSVSSLSTLFAATHSVSGAQEAYQTAMDLARAKGEDLSTATQQVVMAFQGQGRALVGLGINLKDGLSGMNALSAIQGVVKGQADAYADTLQGSMSAALQNVNKLFFDMGTTQLPMLSSLFKQIGSVVDAVDKWTTAHPKLTQAILLTVGVLGGLFTALSAGLVIFGTLATSIAAIGTLFGITAGAVLVAGGIIIGAIVALGVIVTLVVLYHTQIWNAIKTAWDTITAFFKDTWQGITDALKTAWNAIKDFFSSVWDDISGIAKDAINLVVGLIVEGLDMLDPKWRSQWQAMSDAFETIFKGIQEFLTVIWNWISNIFKTSLNDIGTVWNTVWGAVASFFEGIWDGVKNSLSSALSYIRGEIQAFVSWAEGVFQPVLSAVNSIGGAVSSFLSATIKAGSSVTGVHDAIITPGGDVIQSDPADYLIATKSPGSLVGSGAGGGTVINITIAGGYYMDQNAATQIGNALAKNINRSLKLRNYAA
jgi:phage-related protein